MREQGPGDKAALGVAVPTVLWLSISAILYFGEIRLETSLGWAHLLHQAPFLRNQEGCLNVGFLFCGPWVPTWMRGWVLEMWVGGDGLNSPGMFPFSG